MRPSTVESRFEALRTTSTPLIGRDEEIDLLLRRWDQAKRGDGCVMLLSGEPGIGKSRIAETILERSSNEPYTRLRYFCSPHHQDSALYPSITQLERAAGFRRDDTDEQRLDKLESVLAQGTNDLSEAVPLLAELLSIPTGEANRNYPMSHFFLAAALGRLGQLAEARSEARVGLAINPTFTISRYRASVSSDNPTAVAGRDRIIDGLRKAGVPEG